MDELARIDDSFLLSRFVETLRDPRSVREGDRYLARMRENERVPPFSNTVTVLEGFFSLSSGENSSSRENEEPTDSSERFDEKRRAEGVEASGREDEKEEPVVGSSREKEKRNGEKVSKVLRKKMTISQSPALYRVTSRERLERRYV
ncbi:uncharacterized protein LOC143153105 isoform X2 [Ptiloglossa arizonensis]